ncbi:MAG: nuclear transport factor 2 family protein [Mesorhizobium sp.]|uniref:nuclear transport factor 2 family protein n=1 Tax=Mesorhizobium sp. TaxID=1871066 RepID=UPI000FE7BB2E|nr:nuclear transport factor 2 family protein [Mesorhizobium sp.]RWC86504.1 MAG: nuclear transport factor 2 family protein [Mesorhizobium sp.]
MIAETEVAKFFAAYAEFYNDALLPEADLKDVADIYSSAFISVTPGAVMAGENGKQLIEIMKKGFEGYRTIGAGKMTCKDVSVTPIDRDHCVAKVQWAGEYQNKKAALITIDFEVSYLLERRDGKLKVFGWISGDEQAEFRKHGLL